MLRSLKDIIGYALWGTDGEIGKCHDFLFDDRQWGIRYMVADTGNWLPGRKVLVSPITLGKPGRKNRKFNVSLSRKQIENCPPLDKDMPVSREYEKRWFDHFGFPYYWDGNLGLWGMSGHPIALYQHSLQERIPENREAAQENKPDQKNHLRSVREIKGYDIRASDESIGHVEDMIADDETWAIRYIVADTRNWLPGGKKVLVYQKDIEDVSWKHRTLGLSIDSESVRNSPEYEPSMPINQVFEIRRYDFYGRPHDTP